MSPSHAVQLMKGYTSRMLFRVEEDKLKAFTGVILEYEVSGAMESSSLQLVTSRWRKRKSMCKIMRLMAPKPVSGIPAL